jgi:hypothetical protein
VVIPLILLGTLIATPAASQTPPPAPPQAAPAIQSKDLRMVQRAETILSAPNKWNRTDTGACAANASKFSIYCALEKASKDLTGTFDDGGPVMQDARAVVDFIAAKKYEARLIDYNNDPKTTFADVQAFLRILENRMARQLALPEAGQPKAPTSCQFHLSKNRWQGSCGSLFGQIMIARAKSITTGVWRKDIQPTAVWAGSMTDNESSDAAVEIEVYAGDAGVFRTEYGWFPISAFEFGASRLQFKVDAEHEVPPNTLDRDILQRAAAILTSNSAWNRADDRQCPATATTWSIYCAEERASIEVTGGFHHRRPALELLRQIIDERAQSRQYSHRLMDYNNDPSTHLADVRSLFVEAIARIK